MYEKVLRTTRSSCGRSAMARIDIQEATRRRDAPPADGAEHRCGEPVGVYWLRCGRTQDNFELAGAVP